MQEELQRHGQHAQTVGDRATEVDGRGLLEVGGRTAHLADLEACIEDLRQHLVVEDEVVGVLGQGKCFEHRTGEGAVARVVLRELRLAEQVLDRGQGAVRDVFVERHAASASAPAQDARAEDDVEGPVGDQADHGRDELRRILVVRVEHHGHVRAEPERLGVAGLLVASVSAIGFVDDGPQAESPGDLDRLVAAGVVGDHDLVDEVQRDLVVGPLDRAGRVVRGHDDDDFLPMEHARVLASPAAFGRSAAGYLPGWRNG